jgi:hypothetical protein
VVLGILHLTEKTRYNLPAYEQALENFINRYWNESLQDFMKATDKEREDHIFLSLCKLRDMNRREVYYPQL